MPKPWCSSFRTEKRLRRTKLEYHLLFTCNLQACVYVWCRHWLSLQGCSLHSSSSYHLEKNTVIAILNVVVLQFTAFRSTECICLAVSFRPSFFDSTALKKVIFSSLIFDNSSWDQSRCKLVLHVSVYITRVHSVWYSSVQNAQILLWENGLHVIGCTPLRSSANLQLNILTSSDFCTHHLQISSQNTTRPQNKQRNATHYNVL